MITRSYIPMPNSTLQKFAFPYLQIAQNDHWIVLLRRPQITLGSLVIVTRHEETALSEINKSSFQDLSPIIQSIEKTLKKLWQYDKINYLMLMMVDPHVHWHVIPRYQNHRQWKNQSFVDLNWPKAPDLADAIHLSSEIEVELLVTLKNNWDH